MAVSKSWGERDREYRAHGVGVEALVTGIRRILAGASPPTSVGAHRKDWCESQESIPGYWLGEGKGITVRKA